MRSFWKGKKILVTGGHGFIGRHLVRKLLEKRGVEKRQLRLPDSKQYDLRIFENAKRVTAGVDLILHLAADVGGINYSNTYPASQFRNCTLIDLHIFEAAFQNKVGKIVAISSSVAYPKDTRSPLKESDLFFGEPAQSAYGYGFAKRNTVILARVYHQERGLNTVVLLPNNAYGPGQPIDLKEGHVIPSLIYKCLTRPKLTVWGDGKAVRDFLYVEDFVEGVLLAAEKLNSPEPVNLGTGIGVSIRDLVKEIVSLTNFSGKVSYDVTKPGGQRERIVDITKARELLGFEPGWTLRDGLAQTVSWIKEKIGRIA